MAPTLLLLYEFGDYQPLPEEIALPAFKAYLKEVWQNRHLLYANSQEAEQDIIEEQQADLRRQEQGILKFDGNYIQARNYVGTIYFQGITIQILPKLFKNTSVSAQTAFGHLLFYLSYGSVLRFPYSWQQTGTAPAATFLQLLIHLFAAYAEKILSTHPYYTYQEIHEPSAFMRGRLDVPAYMRHSFSSGQWQDLHVQHSPFLYDNTFNRLVKYTVQLLVPVAAAKSQPLLQNLQFMLQEVSDARYTYYDCEKLENSPLSPDHQQILSMCRLFLASQMVKPPEAAGNYFSFLVPMEKVFEDFVYAFIHKHLPGLNAQAQSAACFARVNGLPAFQIINDIWLPGSRTVIDTKYKLLNLQSADLRKGISQPDLYQMLSYAHRRKAHKVHMLYPGTAAAPESILVEIENNFDKERIPIHIHLLPILANPLNDDSVSIDELLVPVLEKAFRRIFENS